MAEVKLDFTSDTTQAIAGINKVNRSLDNLKSGSISFGKFFKGTIFGLSTGFTTLAVSLEYLSTGLIKTFKDIVDFSGAMKDTADSTGATVGQVVILTRAFEAAGMQASDVESTLVGMNQKLTKQNPEILKWINQFGLTWKGLIRLDMASRFSVIAKKIGALKTETAKASAASAFFGKGFAAGLGRLFGDKGAISDAKDYLGLLPTQMDAIAGSLEAFGDAVDGIKYKFRGFIAGITSGLLPIFRSLTDYINKLDLSKYGQMIGDVLGTFIDLVRKGDWKTIGKIVLGSILQVVDKIVTILSFALIRAFQAALKWLQNTDFWKKLGLGGLVPTEQKGVANADSVRRAKVMGAIMYGHPLSLLSRTISPWYRKQQDKAISDVAHNRIGILQAGLNLGAFGLAGQALSEQNIAKLPQAMQDMISTFKATVAGAAAAETMKDFEDTLHGPGGMTEGLNSLADSLFALFGVAKNQYQLRSAAEAGFEGRKGGKPLSEQEDLYDSLKLAKPVVASYYKVGGGGGPATGMSLASFHRESLRWQKETAVNTRGMRTGATFQ